MYPTTTATARTQRQRRETSFSKNSALSSVSVDSSSLLSAIIDLESVKGLLTDSFTGDLDLTKAAPVAAVLLPLIFLAAAKPPARLVSPTVLQAIVEGTFLERAGNSDLQCVYKASRDGWSATNFHDAADNAGSAVVVGRTLTGKVFGAYNPVG